MQILVVGAGAVGSLIAAYLAQAGQDVVLTDAAGERLTAVGRDGVRVTGFRGDFTAQIPVKAMADLSSADAPEFVLMCVHPDNLAARTAALSGLFAETATFVPFMSGLAPFALAAQLGQARSLGAVANFECRLRDDGAVETNFHNFIWIGEWDRTHTERLGRLQLILSQVAPAFMTQVIAGILWSKAIYSVEAALGALVDAEPVGTFAQAVNRRLAAALVRENIGLAEAAGVTPIAFDFFDPNLYRAENAYQGKVTDIWIKNAWIRHEQFRAGLEGMFAPQVGLTRLMSPANPDQEASALFAALLAEADKRGHALPLTAQLADLHREIAAGERDMGWHNLEGLELVRDTLHIAVPYPAL